MILAQGASIEPKTELGVFNIFPSFTTQNSLTCAALAWYIPNQLPKRRITSEPQGGISKEGVRVGFAVGTSRTLRTNHTP